MGDEKDRASWLKVTIDEAGFIHNSAIFNQYLSGANIRSKNWRDLRVFFFRKNSSSVFIKSAHQFQLNRDGTIQLKYQGHDHVLGLYSDNSTIMMVPKGDKVHALRFEVQSSYDPHQKINWDGLNDCRID